MKRSPVTPSLLTLDMSQTIGFYTEKLGFAKTGSWSEEDGREIWAELSCGEARIWFVTRILEGDDQPRFTGQVDEMAERLSGKLPLSWGPEPRPCGLREYAIEDNNGYKLVFAKDVPC